MLSSCTPSRRTLLILGALQLGIGGYQWIFGFGSLAGVLWLVLGAGGCVAAFTGHRASLGVYALLAAGVMVWNAIEVATAAGKDAARVTSYIDALLIALFELAVAVCNALAWKYADAYGACGPRYCACDA
jgi:hypothetical protein